MDPGTARRNELLRDTLRRFVRRGARSSISKLLAKVRPEDVATLMRAITPSERLEVFRILIADYPDAVGDVLTELEAPQRNELLERVGSDEVALILERLPSDDAVFLLETLPEDFKEQVLTSAGNARGHRGAGAAHLRGRHRRAHHEPRVLRPAGVDDGGRGDRGDPGAPRRRADLLPLRGRRRAAA